MPDDFVVATPCSFANNPSRLYGERPSVSGNCQLVPPYRCGYTTSAAVTVDEDALLRCERSPITGKAGLPFGMGIRNMPVAAFAAGVARRLQDRPVVDRTGLDGRYDAQVLWRPDDATPEQLAQIPPARRPPNVNIFETFEQQAGLRLEARRESIEVLVVDHIHRADEN